MSRGLPVLLALRLCKTAGEYLSKPVKKETEVPGSDADRKLKPFADFKIRSFELTIEVEGSDGRVFKKCETTGGPLDTVVCASINNKVVFEWLN